MLIKDIFKPAARAALCCGVLAGTSLLPMSAMAQTTKAAPEESAPTVQYKLSPSLDTASMDTKVNPCDDFYQYACGNYATLHPIPADQSSTGPFYEIFNVNTQRLNGILTKYEKPSAARTPNEQKIGDYYAACTNTALINEKGMAAIAPLFEKIDHTDMDDMARLVGELQRVGVNVFFSFGEQQDFKDSTKQVADVDQGGLGLPNQGYYTRTGAKDIQIRAEYVTHMAKMLTLGGEDPAQANVDAQAILAFETKLADASMTEVARRDPMNVYHPETLAAFEKTLPGVSFDEFLQGIHSPKIDSVINSSPAFFPAMLKAVDSTDMHVLREYMKYEVLTTFAGDLPKAIDTEDFHFYGTVLEGQPQQKPRWKTCSEGVDGALGEALGQVYVQDYFAGDSKTQTLQMVHDIEAAMDQDLSSLDWMSPETRAKAIAKLHLITDKIGYPNKWRDYSKLIVSPTDAIGNRERATAFENDRELNKIGQPVDKGEWAMTPPTVNAYYDPSMNNINFPAGILEPPFFDPHVSIALNYGHIGAIMGHELTHAFDDSGSKFDGHGNLVNWWMPTDKAHFVAKTSCLVHEYDNFVAVGTGKDAAHVNGKLTLGENTADNGGLTLAYMAYLARAKKDGIDIHKKVDGFTGPQQFYIAFAQDWCSNTRPAALRNEVKLDPHSPDHIRANGAIVNQPGFGPAFGCKKGSPMVPVNNCRVW